LYSSRLSMFVGTVMFMIPPHHMPHVSFSRSLVFDMAAGVKCRCRAAIIVIVFILNKKYVRELHVIRGSVSSARYLSSLYQVVPSVMTGLHNSGHQVTVATVVLYFGSSVWNLRHTSPFWYQEVFMWLLDIWKIFASVCYHIYTGCITTLGHNCRRWFPRSLWSKKFI
jgi:hypothetical protein